MFDLGDSSCTLSYSLQHLPIVITYHGMDASVYVLYLNFELRYFD